MAATASPMASQLKSSFVASTPSSRGLIAPKGISGSPLQAFPSRRTASLTIRAVQADKVSIVLAFGFSTSYAIVMKFKVFYVIPSHSNPPDN